MTNENKIMTMGNQSQFSHNVSVFYHLVLHSNINIHISID